MSDGDDECLTWPAKEAKLPAETGTSVDSVESLCVQYSYVFFASDPDDLKLDPKYSKCLSTLHNDFTPFA